MVNSIQFNQFKFVFDIGILMNFLWHDFSKAKRIQSGNELMISISNWMNEVWNINSHFFFAHLPICRSASPQRWIECLSDFSENATISWKHSHEKIHEWKLNWFSDSELVWLPEHMKVCINTEFFFTYYINRNHL